MRDNKLDVRISANRTCVPLYSGGLASPRQNPDRDDNINNKGEHLNMFCPLESGAGILRTLLEGAASGEVSVSSFNLDPASHSF